MCFNLQHINKQSHVQKVWNKTEHASELISNLRLDVEYKRNSWTFWEIHFIAQRMGRLILSLCLELIFIYFELTFSSNSRRESVRV